MKRYGLFALVLTAALLAAPLAHAKKDKSKTAPEEVPWSRAYVQLGAFLLNTDSGFRLGADNIGLGIDINVEKFLGLDETNTAFRFDGGWRFSRNMRHSLHVNWFSLSRRGTTFSTEGISLPGGGEIPPNSTIESIFNFDILKVKYKYSFLLDERVDLNVGGGLYIMPIELGLGKVGEDFTEESITAPLPVLSMGFHFALTPKWFLRQDIDVLYLKISGFEGNVLDLNLALERSITKHIGLGLGFESLNIEIEAESEDDHPTLDFAGKIGFGYSGLQFYVKGAF